MRLLLAGVLLACLMPTPAAIAAPPDPAVEESIVVRGMTQRALRDEVDKMIAAPWDHQLARWGSTFCPDVEGLPAPYHDVVMEHVERAAHAAISDLSTTCEKANVFILFADDGSAAFDQILARSPDLGNHVRWSRSTPEISRPPTLTTSPTCVHHARCAGTAARSPTPHRAQWRYGARDSIASSPSGTSRSRNSS